MALPVRKTSGPNAQLTMNMFLAVVSDGSSEKWPEHGKGIVHLQTVIAFSLVFTQTQNQYVSTRLFESFNIYIAYVWCLLQKKSHFLRLTVKNASLSLHCFACRANQD